MYDNWTSWNVNNLHEEIKESKQFCLWIYSKNIKSGSKPSKIPYGYSEQSKKLIPSLKNKDLWFDFSTAKALLSVQGNEFGLGLILIDGPFTVIDIDQYKAGTELDRCLSILALLGCYIEASPSSKGLHIIFRGIWPYVQNKGEKVLANYMTCEVYSGKDIRYMTCTGQIMQQYRKFLPTNEQIDEVLNAIYMLFFVDKPKKQKSILQNEINIIDNKYQVSYLDDMESEDDFLDIYTYIQNNILMSSKSGLYKRLCQENNPRYKSSSEADWAYFNIILDYVKSDYENKFGLLLFFYKKDRPFREKKSLEVYLSRTIEKVLESRDKDKIADQTDCPALMLEYKKSNEVSKNDLIKICNAMNIFHLGRTVKNITYLHDKENNYIKATIPHSLNQTDFVYYIEILKQYTESINNNPSLLNNYIPISISKIEQNLGKSHNGATYQYVLNTINKLSYVHLECIKKIRQNPSIIYKKGGSLLTYDFRVSLGSLREYKKVKVLFHPIYTEMLLNSDYNYAIFNNKSFSRLKSNHLKLLYYHVALSTLPGSSYNKKYSFQDLLKLWPLTENRNTKKFRVKQLRELLDDFVLQAKNLEDIEVMSYGKDQDYSGIQIKKRKMRVS